MSAQSAVSAEGPPMARVSRPPPSRSIWVAGYLAILFGVFGVLAGVAAAATFIPYRNESTFNPSYAELFTAISAVGAAASVLGVVAGWGLLRTRSWAWGLTAAVAAGSVALNAAMAAFWLEYLPFLVLVALAYGFVVLLLLVGRRGQRVRRSRAAAT